MERESQTRWPRRAKLVDGSRAPREITKKTLETARLKTVQPITMDALAYVIREGKSGGQYGVIFAGPPYCKGPLDRDYLAELLEGDLRKLLKPDGIFVAEAEVGWGITQEDFIVPNGWKLLTRREYGKNALLFFQSTE